MTWVSSLLTSEKNVITLFTRYEFYHKLDAFCYTQMPMTIEVKLSRFKKEKKQPYHVEPGSFESALMMVKEVFDEETLGVSDTSFWHRIENKVTMNKVSACFQYYIAGVGHITLSEMLLNYFQQVRSARLSGDLSPAEYGEKRNKLADALFPLYPERYREEIERARKKR